MEIGNQIKTYRRKLGISQEELAEKVFVSRQTISNWETSKNYPDIHSLLLLSNLFLVSLDDLVKGDIERMKIEIKKEDIKKLNKDSAIFAILLLSSVICFVPLFLYAGIFGLVLWFLFYFASIYYACKLEKQKKKHELRTYKEIVAFKKGEKLGEIEKNREIGKSPYQTILYVIVVCIITAFIAGSMYLFFYLL